MQKEGLIKKNTKLSKIVGTTILLGGLFLLPSCVPVVHHRSVYHAPPRPVRIYRAPPIIIYRAPPRPVRRPRPFFRPHRLPNHPRPFFRPHKHHKYWR